MFQTILTILCAFIVPIPVWLMLFHFVSLKTKSLSARIITYLSLSLLWAIVGYLCFTNQELLYKYRFMPNLIFEVIGILLILVALVIDYFIIKQLGLRRLMCLAELQEKKTEGTLVAHGIYKYARHPRYGELILFFFGVALLSGYYSYLLLSLYLFAGFYLSSFFEEKELVLRFGEAYKDYQKKVPRFFVKCP